MARESAGQEDMTMTATTTTTEACEAAGEQWAADLWAASDGRACGRAQTVRGAAREWARLEAEA